MNDDLRDLQGPYGRPLNDYEIAAIQRGGYTNQGIASAALGFEFERFAFADVQAVSCTQCGVLLAFVIRHMVRHRRECGWEA